MDVIGAACPHCHGDVAAERMPLTGQTRDRCGRCGYTRLHRPMRIGDPVAHAQVLRVAQGSARAPREMPAPMGFTIDALAELRRRRLAGKYEDAMPESQPDPGVALGEEIDLPTVAAVRSSRRRAYGGRPGRVGPRHHARGALQAAVLAAMPTLEAEAMAQDELAVVLAPVLAHSALPQRLLGQTLLRLSTRGDVQRKPIGGDVRKRWAYWRAA